MNEKIYIVPGNLNHYFLFIERLVKFGYVKPNQVSKERQVLIIHPDQLKGIQGKVFLLQGAHLNEYYSQIKLQLQLRSKVLKVFECSPLVTEEEFFGLF